MLIAQGRPVASTINDSAPLLKYKHTHTHTPVAHTDTDDRYLFVMIRRMILLALSVSVLPAAASGLDGHWSVAPITIKIGHRRRTPIRSVSPCPDLVDLGS